ncbi:hypothetical protein [Paraburkholderia sp. BL25I1N1]|uniref:hypothetical protein n=1 Tax=Paraburkholderia sp. BL25I1N1 TaxID=1938804 RepID=UPI0011B1F3E5|nr:hypothetical protein [Paraburkholderia sp. BL25I1N1]
MGWTASLGIRLLAYGNECEARALLNGEREVLINQWHGWGDRRLAVLAAAVVTPDGDSVRPVPASEGPKINPEFHPESRRQIGTINTDGQPDARRDELLNRLLYQIGGALTQVRCGIEIAAPAVTSIERLDASPRASQLLEAMSDKRIRTRALDAGTDLSPSGLFARWADEQSAYCGLVVATQLWGDDGVPSFTEAGAALILASVGVVNTTGVEPIAWLYRPMPTNFAGLTEDLKAMFRSQGKLPDSSTWWLSGMKQPSIEKLFSELSLSEEIRGESGRNVEPVSLDMFIGSPGALREWIALGAACKAALQTETTQFCATELESDFTLARVAAPGEMT